jgi:hypothetical protein
MLLYKILQGIAIILPDFLYGTFYKVYVKMFETSILWRIIMNRKFNFKRLLVAIILIAGGVYGLYTGLIDGFNQYYVIPSIVFVFLGILFARNIKAR